MRKFLSYCSMAGFIVLTSCEACNVWFHKGWSGPGASLAYFPVEFSKSAVQVAASVPESHQRMYD